MAGLRPEAVEFALQGFLRVMRREEVKRRPQGPIHTPGYEELRMSDRQTLLAAIAAAVQLANKKQAEIERSQPTPT